MASSSDTKDQPKEMDTAALQQLVTALQQQVADLVTELGKEREARHAAEEQLAAAHGARRAAEAVAATAIKQILNIGQVTLEGERMFLKRSFTSCATQHRLFAGFSHLQE